MSASREKQNRQERASSGWIDPKKTREEAQRKVEKRNNILYGIIAAVVAIALIASVVWRSNVISRTATAATIDGEKYTAAEVSFYYQNTMSSFLNSYYYVLSYMGLDTSVSLKEQTISDTIAPMLECEAGITWYDYFANETLEQMAMVQSALAAAEAEGFVYPASVQAQYDSSITSLESAAAASNMSVSRYLQNTFGSTITEKIYKNELLRSLQFEAYMSAYEAGLTYSDAELEEAYSADKNSYDSVSYEAVAISGAADSEDDEEPTEEESALAKEAAKTAADEMLLDFQAGASLNTLADNYGDGATYTESDGATYSSSDVVSEWLFDASRKAGDSAVLESGDDYYVVSFGTRFREDYNTINVRHILIQAATGELSSEDEGYEEEQAKLDAEAKAQAEDILAQWKSGEATEESFALLAQEHSSDSSKYDGGLYTRVGKGEMVTAFNDWCFDSSRKVGDTDVIETPYGFHVMYFSGEDLPRWKALVTTDLADEDYNTYVTELTESSNIQSHSFGMKFVG